MSDFNSLLAGMPDGLSKMAQVEAPDEIQLEQDFGRLAYSFLVDQAPGLIPYILGFEVVDREEDGSKAVGIFGFKIGEDYYYVPSFFVDNQVKGMDLLYSKRTNMFMPLKETWINYITDKQTIELGGGPTGNVDELRKDFSQPRFDFLAEPPTFAGGTPKAASAMGHVNDAFSTWNEMQQEMVDAISKDAEFQTEFAGAVSHMEGGEPGETDGSSPVIEWLSKKGGVEAVNALMKTVTENTGFAKAAMEFYPDITDLYVTKFAEDLAPKKEDTKITVVTQVTDYIDGKEKTRLVRDGFTIHDTRDAADKSETYEVDYEKRFHNPEQSGLYDVLMAYGGTVRCWVFMPSGDSQCGDCIVVKQDGKHFFVAEPQAIYVRGDDMHADEEPAYDAAIPLTDMKIGNKYILINKDNNATYPFEIRNVIAESGKRIMFKVNWDYYNAITRPTYGHDFDTLHASSRDMPVSPDEDTQDVKGRSYLQLADYNNGALSFSGTDTVVVPSDWKAVELQDKDYAPFDSSVEPPADDAAVRAAEDIARDMFKPGTLTDVFTALSKNALHKLTVASDDGLEYYVRFDDDFVDGKPSNYKSASVKLISKYGLSVDDTEEMLKEAQDKYKSRRLVKLGQMVGVDMPYPPQPGTGQDPYTGAATVDPQADIVSGQTVGAPVPQDSMAPGFNLGGEAQMDMQSAGLAEQAAASGQKKVFDHSVIGGLAKLYDTGAVIDTYIPELRKALDRVGRILFLFYWKNKEFAERYGTEDIAEMEATIRGVFKNYGDLVLELEQKAVGDEEE